MVLIGFVETDIEIKSDTDEIIDSDLDFVIDESVDSEKENQFEPGTLIS